MGVFQSTAKMAGYIAVGLAISGYAEAIDSVDRVLYSVVEGDKLTLVCGYMRTNDSGNFALGHANLRVEDGRSFQIPLNAVTIPRLFRRGHQQEGLNLPVISRLCPTSSTAVPANLPLTHADVAQRLGLAGVRQLPPSSIVVNPISSVAAPIDFTRGGNCNAQAHWESFAESLRRLGVRAPFSASSASPTPSIFCDRISRRLVHVNLSTCLQDLLEHHDNIDEAHRQRCAELFNVRKSDDYFKNSVARLYSQQACPHSDAPPSSDTIASFFKVAPGQSIDQNRLNQIISDGLRQGVAMCATYRTNCEADNVSPAQWLLDVSPGNCGRRSECLDLCDQFKRWRRFYTQHCDPTGRGNFSERSQRLDIGRHNARTAACRCAKLIDHADMETSRAENWGGLGGGDRCSRYNYVIRPGDRPNATGTTPVDDGSTSAQ